MGKVTKIALTGGPCGGKSTSISILEQELTNKGYKVFIVEEMATNVIQSGASPVVIGGYEFQDMLLQLQYYRNKVYDEMAFMYTAKHNKDVVIIYDRGIPDSKGFMSDEDYSRLLSDHRLSEIAILDYYDGVFHLVTAADGAEESYTCENNAARTETPEQARERDKQCMRAWTGHNHLRVIQNHYTFREKINKLLEEVYTLLGIPVPIEIERKYLIEMPDMELLNKQYDCTTVDIIQNYLISKDGVERRVRQRGSDGSYTFYYTEKTPVNDSGLERTEKEKKISQEEYLKLLMEVDTNLRPIRKQRTCFVSNGSYFELDIYPFWDSKAILEIELTNPDAVVNLPKELTIIKEVTDDDAYKNYSLAKTQGEF